MTICAKECADKPETALCRGFKRASRRAALKGRTMPRVGEDIEAIRLALDDDGKPIGGRRRDDEFASIARRRIGPRVRELRKLRKAVRREGMKHDRQRCHLRDLTCLDRSRNAG